MTTYTDVFGNDTIPPAGQAYAAVTLSADTQFYWPEMPGSANVLASVVNVTASGNYALKLPDASQVSTGRDCLIYNVGANTFTIADSTGSTLFTVSSGVAVFVYLTDNSTAAGTWSTFTFGAGTAATAAATLAGNGLKSLNNLIVANELVSLQLTDYTVVAGDRAHLIAFTSGSATCTLPTTASVDDGFFFAVRNSGSGTITLTPSGGVYIDGAASKAIAPTEGLICYTDGTDWYTVGHGRSTSFQFTAFVKDLTGIAAYTMTTADAANKLLQFTGAPSANTTITIPSVVAVYYVQINTSNAYTVAFKTATGTTVTLNQNDYAIILCDGVDTVLAQTASTPPNVSVATGMLANTNGGTGQNSSAWTGVPQVVAGTWSAAAAVAANYGGTGVANNAANTITFSGNYGLTLTLSNTTGVTLPTTGTLAALGVAQSWTAAQTYDNSTVKIKGSSTGVTTITSANAGASNYTLTVPAVTDTVALLGTAQTFSAAQNFTSDIKLTGSSGTSGQVLTSAGSGAAPTWATPATGSDSITVIQRTSNTILDVSNKGNLIDVTSGTFTQTFDAAATLGAGWWCYYKNSGSGDVTLEPNGAETIDGLANFIAYTGELRIITCDGSNLYSFVLNPFYRVFTASGTFTKPPGYQAYGGLLWGGGASGARNSATYDAGGGGGGGCTPFTLAASSVGTTETVTIASTTAGRATNGLGTAGGNSTFGSLATGYGGGAGGYSAATSFYGGSGGGVLGAGNTGTGVSGYVRGGLPSKLAATSTSLDGDFGGGGVVSTNAGNSAYGGGGGSAGSGTGGSSLFGGGGGGGTAGGGSSVFGGAGGIGRLTAGATDAGDGTAPGGGGGGVADGTGTSGDGARGELRIWGII